MTVFACTNDDVFGEKDVSRLGFECMVEGCENAAAMSAWGTALCRYHHEQHIAEDEAEMRKRARAKQYLEEAFAEGPPYF